jgi:ankyrin repeat protein
LGIAAAPFASDSSLPASSSGLKELGKKRSFWTVSLGRKSDSILENSTANRKYRSPTPGSRRGIRGFENNFHTSIDFASPDGMNCPQIVRAAQAGSIVEIETLLDDGADIEECHQPTGRNAMAVAAHCGNADVVELLLRYGAKISMRDASSSTPLHLAASRGHTGVMTILLFERARTEDKGPDDRTPLRLSCDNGHFEAAELLLLHQARVNARDKSNLTALHAASKRGNADIVSLLIRHGADVEAKDGQFMTALHHASEGGHSAVVELLLNKKADIEMPGNDGKSPLVSAAATGAVHVVELLLRRKASLRSRGAGEMTALHWAASNGRIDVVDLLLQKKAAVNAVNIDGRTALHLAVMAEQFPVVELLLRKNATIEAQCKLSLRPLHYACGFEIVDIVRLLLHSGAQLEAEGNGRQRPLHLAATRGVLPIVIMLLEKGANIDIRDAAGDRPLLLATSRGHVEVVRAFLDWHAPIRAKFTAGPSHDDSPLCLAARNGHADVVTLLLSRGASVREKDEFDWPPLRYAAHYGHPDVVERLLMNGASLSGIQSWGFNLTADRIGFAKHVDIPEDRKESVMRLLRDAEEREMLIQERQAASSAEPKKYASTAPAQTGASELDHGVDIRPPLLRELFSPDNARYTTKSDNKPLVQLESGNPSSVSDSPRPNGVVPTSISTVSDNGPKQTSYQFTPQQRVSGAISAWPTIDSDSSSTGPQSAAMARFSYLTTPPAVDMTPVKIVPALNSEEISSNSNSTNFYQDRRRNAWNRKTSLESMREDHQIDSTMQDHTSLPGQNSSPSQRRRTVPPSWSARLGTTNTLSLEALEGLVKERRRGGFSFLPGPGSSTWHLADVESMIHAYRQTGVTYVGLAEEGGYRPTQPPEDQHVSSVDTTITDNPFDGHSDTGPSSNHAAEINSDSRYPRSPPPPTRPPPAPPSGAIPTALLAGLDLKSAQRFASSPSGIFEMPAFQ